MSRIMKIYAVGAEQDFALVIWRISFDLRGYKIEKDVICRLEQTRNASI